MQRLIFVLTTLVFLFFGFGVSRSFAQYACTGWVCEFTDVDGGTEQTCTGTPAGCSDALMCSHPNADPIDCIENVSCGPGYYVCNTGCCAIGTGDGCECGVKADGSTY